VVLTRGGEQEPDLGLDRRNSKGIMKVDEEDRQAERWGKQQHDKGPCELEATEEATVVAPDEYDVRRTQGSPIGHTNPGVFVCHLDDGGGSGVGTTSKSNLRSHWQ